MKTLTLVLLFTVMGSATNFSQEKNPALDEVVEAERAFARASVAKGIRDSFIEFFADDGINFLPHPTNTKEAFSKRPAKPSPYRLDWHPITADVSQSGDLGYTTGPYTLVDTQTNKLIEQGYYFSIWKKQRDGQWKVIVDCGIETKQEPAEKYFTAARPLNRKVFKAKGSPELIREELLKVDREFATMAQQAGTDKAYFALVTDEVRIFRDSRLPMLGASAFRAYLAQNRCAMTSEPITAEVAASNDFGYTYGRYESQFADAHKPEKGYYVRTWKRDAKGHWKIVVETLTRLPAEAQ
ncbi:MAG: nuclear transport factor 2 family protein [Acidobacteria bacterium]|nr:nuclear transport factor 2 family protein [Acidobacteriota bacterium]